MSVSLSADLTLIAAHLEATVQQLVRLQHDKPPENVFSRNIQILKNMFAVKGSEHKPLLSHSVDPFVFQISCSWKVHIAFRFLEAVL